MDEKTLRLVLKYLEVVGRPYVEQPHGFWNGLEEAKDAIRAEICDQYA